MIQGRVLHRQAELVVPIHLPDGTQQEVYFVVDTGFTGALTLPLEWAEAWQLPYVGSQSANLANDAEIELPIYAAVVVWNGEVREMRVLATGRRPLLGTALLNGCELLARFIENGLVTVQEIEAESTFD